MALIHFVSNHSRGKISSATHLKQTNCEKLIPVCNDVLKLDFDRWHVDILCDPMQPSWHIEGNPDTDSLPRRRVAQSVAYRGGGGGCNLMQSSSRAAGGGRTPDDGNWPDQARIEHSAQIHTYTNTQIHKYTHIHMYTNTPAHNYTC